MVSGLVLALLFCTAPARAANLLPAPGFETDADGDGVADGWRPEIHQGAEGRFDLDSKVKVEGSASQHIVHSNASSEWVRVSVLDIPAAPNTPYRLSGHVRAAGPWIVLLYEFPRSGNYLTHSIARGEKTDGWTSIGGAVRTGPEAHSFKVSLITCGKGEVWFDEFSLERLDEPPDLIAPELTEAPAIDGRIIDAAWRQAEELGPFMVLGGNGEAAAPATTVRIGVRGDVLYAAWRCREPKTSALHPVGPKPSWNDDTVELFLAPGERSGGYYHFGVTPFSGRLSERKHRPGASYYVDWYSTRTVGSRKGRLPELPWKAAARVGDGEWTVEMAVDLDGLAEFARPWAVWRLQLARSRKVSGREENSCWAWTPGETFHAPRHFGFLALPFWRKARLPVVKAPPFDPAAVPLRIVPQPRRVKVVRGGPILLPERIIAACSDPDAPDAAARALRRVFERFGCRVALVPLRNAGAAQVVIGAPEEHSLLEAAWGRLREEAERMPAWRRAEAYVLDSSGKAIVISAPGERGRFYGVQTLRQILTTDGRRVWVRRVRVSDWPDLRRRGWHLIGPETHAAVPEAKRIVDVLAALKLNWIAFQIDNRMQYTRDPDLGRPGAPTKDEWKDLVRYAEDRLFEVIPMTQCWSHFAYFLGKPKYRHLAEIPNPPKEARRKFWNYCPRNPDTHRMLFGMIEEQLECFPNARYFHCGLDEIRFEPIGVCPRCKGTPGWELLAEEVKRLHDFLAGKHLTMCMWGDQLLVEHNGGPPYDTAKALPSVPRDVVIFDWHYGVQDDYPSVAFFRRNGFPVVACGWYEPLDVMNLSRTAWKQRALGYGGTTWYSIARIADEIRLMTAIPLTAENTWTVDRPRIEEIRYRPAEVFQDLRRERPQTRPAAFRPVDLRPWCNRTLADDDRRMGWLGLGHEFDLSALPTGRQWFGGIVFDVPPPDGPQCVVLAASEDADRLPQRAWQVPVNAKAHALAFLHTCSRPDRFSRHIYDRKHVNPGVVVRYVVHYANGRSATVTCRWNQEITDWNSGWGSAHCRTGWLGHTAGGALARVEVFEWRNPYPDTRITAVDVVSARAEVRPVLLGLTVIPPGTDSAR